MTTERFDIEVRDAVAKTIRTELRAIGTEARSTHTLVQQLNRELVAGTKAAANSAQTAASQAAAAAGQSAAAQARNTAETARATAAQARLTAEQSKAGLAAERLAQAEAKTALAKQKVATEAARTAAAQSKANVAYLQEEEALNRAISAEQRAKTSKDALTAATVRQAEAQRKATIIHDPFQVPQGRGSSERNAGSRSANSAATDTMRQTRVPGGVPNAKEAIREIEELGTKSQMASHHLLNLGFQLNDVFVSLASGQKPLTVFVQQGAQIAQISAQSGVSLGGLARVAGGLVVRALTSVVGVTLSAAAAIGTLAYAAESGHREFATLTNTLSITGNRAQLTARDVYELSDAIAESNNRSNASIRSIAQAYATNGNFSKRAIVDLTQATDKFARLTGQSAEDVISSWSRMTKGPTDFAVELSESYNLLSSKQVEHIRLLEEQGQRTAATDALAAALNGTLKNQTVNLGYLESAWNGVASAISNAWDWLKRWGAEEATRPWSKVVSDLESEIAKRKQYDWTQESVWTNITGGTGRNAEALANAEKQLATARRWAAVEEKRRKDSAAAAGIQKDGIAAHARVVSLSEGVADNNARAARAIKSYRADLEAMRKAGLAVPTAAEQAQVEKKLTERYVPSTRGKPKKDTKTEAERLAERQVESMREINSDLERESIKFNSGLYGIDADVAARMDTIADRLDNVSISLRNADGSWTEYGSEVYKAVRANEEARRSFATLQNAYSSAYNMVNQPAEDWIAARKVAEELLKNPNNDAALVNRWLAGQEEAFRSATNPLYEYNKGIRDQIALQRFYGQELITQTEIQRRYNEQKALDPSSNPDRNTIRQEVERDQKSNDRQGFLGDLESSGMQNRGVGSNEWILQNYQDLYSAIDAMRKGDVESEARAAAAKQELDKRYLTARLEGADQMLGQLSQLQNSKSREAAAIGKAAAIAQATIDGFRAVQAALAGPPGPPWSFAIAAATGAITVANVARIAGVGFQKGGFTGSGMDHEPAGDVHKNEFVFDAGATRRIGVPALEAMRRGTLTRAPANDNRGMRGGIRIVQGPGTYVEAVEKSDGEIEIIAERVARRVAPAAVAADLRSNPSGRMGTALKTSYGVVRADR